MLLHAHLRLASLHELEQHLNRVIPVSSLREEGNDPLDSFFGPFLEDLGFFVASPNAEAASLVLLRASFLVGLEGLRVVLGERGSTNEVPSHIVVPKVLWMRFGDIDLGIVGLLLSLFHNYY